MEMYACVDDGANRYLGGLKSVGNGNFILELLRITGFKLIQIWGACILFIFFLPARAVGSTHMNNRHVK